MNSKKKTLIISSIVVLLLLVIVGSAYAFFTYESDTKSDIVTGQIYMNYEETSTISLTGVFPETKEQALARTDENGVFEFTITGRNTSKYPVYYEIDLLEGGVMTGKTEQSTKILPEHVMIYLEKDGVPVINGKTYADWNNKPIYVETVPAGTTSNIEHKYTLRMWISENVTISDTDPNADYTTTEWNNVYASLKVRVVGDFVEKTLPTAVETIVDSVGTNGLVAINEDGELIETVEVQTNSNKNYKVTPLSTYNGQTVREYRYSGSNDVVTNNYVSFNNELWRIIGVFPTEKEDGTTEELIKIIKVEPLSADEIPTTYTYNNVEMVLKSDAASNTVYWNKNLYFGQTNYNDWTKAAIQYFLNDETDGSASYYNSINLDYQNMIEDVIYHLGNVTIGDNNTASFSYTEERSGAIRNGNEEIWRGKIGLVYPSDYGYASDSANWSIAMNRYSSIVGDYNWLYYDGNGGSDVWTISPASAYFHAVPSFKVNVTNGLVRSMTAFISPVLYLKSDVMFIGGDGSYNTPYLLSL